MRFSYFTNKLEISSLKNVTKVYDGTHQTPNYVSNGIRFVSVENISDLYSSRKYISISDYERDFKIVPNKDDILMTRIGDIGTPALITNEEKLAYYVSLALLKVKKIAPSFLYYYIQSPYFQKELWHRTLHVAFPKKINKNEIGECRICYPNNQDEQIMIADFLSKVEKRIVVQNKIISKYETLIKGLCKRLSGNNKSCKLSDLVVCKTSLLQENKVRDKGQYPVFGASGVIGYLDSYQFDKDAILILKDGSKVGKVQFAAGKYSVVGTSVVLIPKSVQDAKYLYFSILTIDFNKYKVGSGIPHIYFKDYSGEKIYYPAKTQRTTIVKLLSGYESKLNIEKEMLSALQKQKAFLLQSMFI